MCVSNKCKSTRPSSFPILVWVNIVKYIIGDTLVIIDTSNSVCRNTKISSTNVACDILVLTPTIMVFT